MPNYLETWKGIRSPYELINIPLRSMTVVPQHLPYQHRSDNLFAYSL